MNAQRTELGKIKEITFGFGGYQDACIGLNVTLGGEGWGVQDGKTAWDANMVEVSEYMEWTEEDRSKQYDEIVRYVSDLLAAAKVSSIDKLQGIPVEVTFDGNLLKKWRILTEVI